MADLDLQLQEQERIINISYALASEASQRSKQVAGEAEGASLQPCLGSEPSMACQGVCGKPAVRRGSCGPARHVFRSHQHSRVGEVSCGGVGGGRTEVQECPRLEVQERVS